MGSSCSVFPVISTRDFRSRSAHGDGFVDLETRSRRDVLGRATAGTLKAAQLDAVRHPDPFWFAWVSFHPETELLNTDKSEGAE